MNTNFKTDKLTSGEISQLWGAYMGDISQICVLSHFLKVIEDEEIKKVVELAYTSSERHVQKISEMFKSEGHEVPEGFSLDTDVEKNAPRLFTDHFILEYLHQFSRIGLRGHGLNLSLMAREDVTEFFKECISETIELYKNVKNVLIAKGLYTKSPFLEEAHKVDHIEKQNFLTGFFGDKRALTASEVANLHANFQRNALGAATLIGFSQVARTKEAKKHFIRGKEIAEKHCELFNSYLKENELPAALYWDSQVTENTQPVFSDKLMMYLGSALTSLGIGFYGLSLGIGMRRDLGSLYNRLLMEVQLFAEDGANIMINHGWLESPPIVKKI